MSEYYLGIDVGSTKTHALIGDSTGRALGFGLSGPGNHETVGYDGLVQAMDQALESALQAAGLQRSQIGAAGFGLAGYDWPSEREDTLKAIGALGLQGPVEAVNDASLGLLAGSPQGWGVALVSGTGCNCRGWDQNRQRQGMVTGASLPMGEAAGASELIIRTVWALSYQWSQRGPATELAPLMVAHFGAKDLADLVEGFSQYRYHPDPAAAPLVFQAAEAGDRVANEIIEWAGSELGELACAVIRQLNFEELTFDIVMIGSMFGGGPALIEPLKRKALALAPGARFNRLAAPPVIGGVLLGMDLLGARSQAPWERLNQWKVPPQG